MVSLTRKSRSDRRVICDICGQAYRLSEMTKITDKYNRHFGMMVCPFDRDVTNPHDVPFTVKDVILSSPKMVRDRPPILFDVNALDDRVPGKPKNGIAQRDSLTGSIISRWDGPSDTGSSGIVGYRVQRAVPRGSVYTTLESNTGYGSGFYLDTSGSLSGDYSYKVAAINSFGVGAYSEEWLFPPSPSAPEIPYLLMGQEDFFILTGDGDYLLVSNL